MTAPSTTEWNYFQMEYRDYQQVMHSRIYKEWENPKIKNITAVLPTGAGKALLAAGVARDWGRGEVCCIAHRRELVGQIALALAASGVRHKIIGPRSMVKYVISRQKLKLGTHLFDANAHVTVASVDTLNAPARRDGLKNWAEQVGLWVIDECHHLLRRNKWGKAIEMFPNAHGLGFTATPIRADGHGLGRHAEGVMDSLIEGPTMRELIRDGYLCDYRVFAPLTYMPLTDDDVGASGDYTPVKLKAASKSSPIVGDVVSSYQKFAASKQAVVFATDLETAAGMALSYQDAGITAEVISSLTPDNIRSELLDRFERLELQVIVNVDLLGEGYDCPAISCVIFARPTKSFGLYCQHFGRALRVLEGKSHAIIIDHVGNVMDHGLPDAARVWDLDGRDKRPAAVNPDDDIPLRYCAECTQPYQRIYSVCPWCGHEPVSERGTPEFVDGDVFEISPEILAQLRGEIAKVDTEAQVVYDRMIKAGVSRAIAGATFKNITGRTSMQVSLRESINWWGGMQNARGLSDREAYRLFFHTFGVDVLTAKTLNRKDAERLANKINHRLGGPLI